MRKAFITNTFLIALLVASSVFAAPVRWVGNGHLYDVILVPEGITWTDANVAAQARGSGWHLATITSAEENAFVANLASNPVFWICCSSNNAGGPWLGGFKVGPRVGDYAWVTGEPFVYTKWGPLEPFGNGDRLALFGYQAPTGSTWNDVRATTLARAYIIENQATAGSVFPSSGGDTGSVTVWITGNGFMAGASVKLSRDGEPDVVGDPVTMAEDSQSITTTFDLAGKARGLWDVVVTNPDGTSTTIPQGFTIEEGRAAQLWVDIVGRNAIRVGREQQFFILYGNRGNVDASGGYIFLSVPGGIEFKLGEDQTFSLQSNTAYSLAILTQVRGGATGAIPLILRVPSGTPTVSIRTAITSSLATHLPGADRYEPFSLATSSLQSNINSVVPIATQGDGGTCSDVLLEPGELGGAGTFHLFGARKSDGSWAFGEAAIELPNGRIGWSFPGRGVVEVKFEDVKNGLYDGFQMFHIMGIRLPLSLTLDPATVELRFKEWADHLGTSSGFCLVSSETCVSCMGLVMRILFGGQYPNSPIVPSDFPKDNTTDRWDTTDLIGYLFKKK